MEILQNFFFTKITNANEVKQHPLISFLFYFSFPFINFNLCIIPYFNYNQNFLEEELPNDTLNYLSLKL